jgi:hypothetical protein
MRVCDGMSVVSVRLLCRCGAAVLTWCCGTSIRHVRHRVVSVALLTLWTTVGGCRAAVGVLTCEVARHGTPSLWRRIIHGCRCFL